MEPGGFQMMPDTVSSWAEGSLYGIPNEAEAGDVRESSVRGGSW